MQLSQSSLANSVFRIYRRQLLLLKIRNTRTRLSSGSQSTRIPIEGFGVEEIVVMQKGSCQACLLPDKFVLSIAVSHNPCLEVPFLFLILVNFPPSLHYSLLHSLKKAAVRGIISGLILTKPTALEDMLLEIIDKVSSGY
ncbi:hypothetical protein VTN77DRAFT_2161 [Rasamsonia byssochlamydoides]|uniref:uncharacterized protein n=1 Tax=Rasamsonia byssochlamydoides TaxID=89139 RepID=UPI003742C6D1